MRTVNETKTRLCRLPEESFDFLEYTIGRCYSPRTGEAYLGLRPSRKSIQRFCREISELTERRWATRQVGFQVAELNRKLKGWANYFRLGTVQRAHRLVDNHVRYRLRRWLKAKYKVRGPGKTRFSKGYLYEDLGLYSLQGWAGRSPCAKGRPSLVREPDALNGPVRFDERGVETGHDEASGSSWAVTEHLCSPAAMASTILARRTWNQGKESLRATACNASASCRASVSFSGLRPHMR